MDRIEQLEERVALLIRTVEDVSDVVAAQATVIDRMQRLVTMLAEREARREDMGREDMGEAPAANQKPPHW